MKSKKENETSIINSIIVHEHDYYALLEKVLRFPEKMGHNEIQYLILFSPKSQKIKNLKKDAIRRMIPHWTGSRYHTGLIDDVLNDIRDKILSRDIGFYIYNSNLNIKNLKSYNDIYILLVDKNTSLFIDYNRKRFFEYEMEE